MIKRLHSRKSHGTLVANPGRRRKKRNGAKRRRSTKLSAMVANGRGRRKKRKNPHSKLSHYFARKGRKAAHHKRRRNPEGGGSVDLVSIGIGSVVAIAAGAVGQAIFNQYLDDKIESTPLREAAPSLIVAAGAFAAHKYMKSPKVKQIAKVTMMLAIFKALDKSIGGTIQESVAGILPGGDSGSKKSDSTSKSYVTATKGTRGYLPVTRGTAGAFVTPTGGAYAQLNGLLPGAGLYGL